MNTNDNNKKKNFLSQKSISYINQIRKQKGPYTAELIMNEAKGIMYENNHEGFVFNEKQLKDLMRVLKIEKQNIQVTPVYRDDLLHSEIDYYRVFIPQTLTSSQIDTKIQRVKKKNNIVSQIRNKDKTQKKIEQRKRTKYNKTLIKTDIEQELSIEDFKKKIIEQYGF